MLVLVSRYATLGGQIGAQIPTRDVIGMVGSRWVGLCLKVITSGRGYLLSMGDSEGQGPSWSTSGMPSAVQMRHVHHMHAGQM